MSEAYQYALWRVVPDAARGECLNVGVVVYSRRLRFLGARARVDEGRLAALGLHLDIGAVDAAVALRLGIAAADPAVGRLASLPESERFGALVAPASTVVRPGPVHTGLCDDAAETLDRLYRRLVAAG